MKEGEKELLASKKITAKIKCGNGEYLFPGNPNQIINTAQNNFIEDKKQLVTV